MKILVSHIETSRGMPPRATRSLYYQAGKTSQYRVDHKFGRKTELPYKLSILILKSF
jgi:hypothetical protein